MLSNVILQIYLYMAHVYIYIYKTILNIFGPCYIIYLFDGQNKFNITFKRYFTSYDSNSLFYIKIYDGTNIKHIAYQGDISKFTYIKFARPGRNLCKRKNIMFLDYNKPINFDLNILDNYKQTINLNPDYAVITKLDHITKLLDLTVSDVQIINFDPFKKEVIPISNADINMLYE
jgi:hypothetical protein